MQFSTWEITKAVLIFLGIPLVAGYLTRRIGHAREGQGLVRAARSSRGSAPFALYGLLFTIVVMFALQGDAITQRPGSPSLQIAIPLLVYFAIMWGVVVLRSACVAHLGYPKTATAGLHRRGQQLRAGHRRRIGVWGVTSGQALAGVIGPLIEVPALVGLVYVSLWLRRRWRPGAWPKGA